MRLQKRGSGEDLKLGVLEKITDELYDEDISKNQIDEVSKCMVEWLFMMCRCKEDRTTYTKLKIVNHYDTMSDKS